MPKLKPDTVYPAPEEDVTIQAGIAEDGENPEWTARDFATSRPASEALPPEAFAEKHPGQFQ